MGSHSRGGRGSSLEGSLLGLRGLDIRSSRLGSSLSLGLLRLGCSSLLGGCLLALGGINRSRWCWSCWCRFNLGYFFLVCASFPLGCRLVVCLGVYFGLLCRVCSWLIFFATLGACRQI